MDLQIFVGLLLILAWSLWGHHEAWFLKVKNHLRQASRILKRHQEDAWAGQFLEDLRWADKITKRFMVLMQAVLVITTALVLAIHLGNLWILATLPVYAAASKWLFGEGFYGLAIKKGFSHIGTGGMFDDEISGNPSTYLWVRIMAFALAVAVYLLLGNVVF